MLSLSTLRRIEKTVKQACKAAAKLPNAQTCCVAVEGKQRKEATLKISNRKTPKMFFLKCPRRPKYIVREDSG